MALVLKKSPGKYSLPVCSVCLNPFEDDDELFVIDFKKGLEMANDFRHEQCLQVRSINVAEFRKKYL